MALQILGHLTCVTNLCQNQPKRIHRKMRKIEIPDLKIEKSWAKCFEMRFEDPWETKKPSSQKKGASSKSKGFLFKAMGYRKTGSLFNPEARI